MENSTFVELINNLNQTIDRLTKENEELRNKTQNITVDPNPNTVVRNNQLRKDVRNNNNSSSAINVLSSQELQAFENADYIISKSLDFAFLIRNDIIELLDKMKMHYNSPIDLLNTIDMFIKKNRNIFLYNPTDKELLSEKLILKIREKLARR